MKTQLISSHTREYFKNLILPKVYRAMEEGMLITAIGLSDEGVAIGALVGTIVRGNVFEVQSLYVDKDHRRRGGGTMLVKALQSLLEEKKVPAMLSCLEDDGESDTLIAFMEAIGAVRDTELEELYRGKLEFFWKSGLFNKNYTNPRIKRLTDLNESEQAKARKLISKFKVPVEGNFLHSGGILKNASVVATKAGTVQGVILVCADKSKEPMIIASEMEDNKLLAGMINAGLIVWDEVMGADSYIRVPIWDERYSRLMRKIEGMVNIQHNYLF